MLFKQCCAGLLLLTLPAAAQDAPASVPADTKPGTPAGAAAGGPAYSRDTPVEKLATDPAAVAVLNKDLPGLLTAPEFSIFKSMSLKQLQQASGGDLSEVDVAKAEADLQALPAH
ncbi:MAG TPA: hypothetical protein VFA87_07655 [Rhizomicrobium sp.]|nr:hypothetical protein [Rhizomicrobium sp.]